MKGFNDFRKLPRELWILCLATLVNRLGTMVLPFLVVYLTKALGYSADRAGLALAVYGAVALLIGPLAGKLSDHVGALRLMEGSLLASGIILLVFPAAKSWSAVLEMTVLFAVANESFRPANMSMIGELAGENRKSAFALSRWAVNLGMSVGPALGGFLAQKAFWLLFVVDGASTLGALAILMLSPFHNSVRAREKQALKSREVSWPLAALFADSNLRFFLLAILPVSIVFFQHEGAMPVFLIRDLHLSEAGYGLLFTLNTILIIVLEIPLNLVTAHWSFRRTLSLGATLFAVGFGALALSRTYVEVALTVVVWTFGEMILFPSMSAYVSELAPKHRHGEYMGLYMMAFSVAFTIGPWLGTLTLERWGAIPLWSATFIAGLFSAGVLSLVGGRRARQVSNL